jgi:zinc protease
MVERYTLKNGIPLFIVESHASPVVSIQAWVTRGSINETDKLAGISHFLEHALFKGTKRRGVGEIAAEIESLGGEINAFTSFEETAFYCTLASRYFKDGLDIMADMMQYPAFDKKEMEREREVIIEEIKRAQDSPGKTVSMNLWQASFPNTPFGRPVLGFEKTVSKIDHTTLRSYFEKNYHSGSMALFVVGDVDKKKVFEQVQAKFLKTRKGSATAPLANLKLPRIGSAKIVSASRDLKECHVQVGIRAPSIRDPRVPALDLVCSAIGQGESGRLYQRLVKQTQLAMECHFGFMATSHCGLVYLSLLTAPENLNQALKEAFTVIADAAKKGLEAGEIERVKTSLEADIVAGKETVEGYARRLGYYYSEFGDPQYEGKYLQAILSVDRQKADEALFQVFENRPVVSIVHPTAFKIDRKELLSFVSPRVLKPVVQKTALSRPVKTEKTGVRYITKPLDSLPTISLRLVFPGGSREEQTGKWGVGNLFGRLWTSGTKNYSALNIAQKLESLGASVHGFVGRNTLGLSVECLSKHWSEVKPIFLDTLLEPGFPEQEFTTEKDLILREIHSEKDSPGALCQYNFLSKMYGNHPYGRSPLGTKETVTSLSASDLRAYYKDFVHRKGAVISTVGSIDPQSWLPEIETIINKLPADGKSPMAAQALTAPSDLQIVTESKEPLFQSHCLVGFLGASFKDKERYALKLLSSCLAGQGGRLFLELRDRQSLAYQVAPMNSDSPEPGIFGFYIGCSPEKIDRALSGIRIEIDRILNRPIDNKELDRAKEYWIGRFELEMQRYSAQAMLYGLDEIYGLGFDHSFAVPSLIKDISAKEIQSAAQKYLIPNKATISIVHNEPLDTDRVRKAWEVGQSSVRRSRERMLDSAI